MLTFLRKIRRSLINSGSRKQYLTYAVGEIALVVIGILIALQINNWNEQRKENKWEVYYLNRLQNDLKRDTSEISSTLHRSYRRVTTGNYILSHFGEDFLEILHSRLNKNQQTFIRDAQKAFPNITKDVIFGQAIGSMTHYRRLNLHLSTYNDILSNGRLENIKDDELRESLSTYYQKVSQMNRLEDELDYAVKDYMKVLLDYEVPISNRFSPEEFKNKLGPDKKYVVALKNLIWLHVMTRTANVMSAKRASHQMLEEVEVYLESIQ